MQIIDLNQANKTVIGDIHYRKEDQSLNLKIQNDTYLYSILFLLKNLSSQVSKKIEITVSKPNLTIQAENFSELALAAFISELLRQKNYLCLENP